MMNFNIEIGLNSGLSSANALIILNRTNEASTMQVDHALKKCV